MKRESNFENGVNKLLRELRDQGASSASLIADHVDNLLEGERQINDVEICIADLEEAAAWAYEAARRLRSTAGGNFTDIGAVFITVKSGVAVVDSKPEGVRVHIADND
jgi:hypothetical protein